jgi:hypothetical protein
LPATKHRVRKRTYVRPVGDAFCSSQTSSSANHERRHKGDASGRDRDAVKRSKRTRPKQDIKKNHSRGLERGQGGCRACQARTLVSPGICSREEEMNAKNFAPEGRVDYIIISHKYPKRENAADFAGSGPQRCASMLTLFVLFRPVVRSTRHHFRITEKLFCPF